MTDTTEATSDAVRPSSEATGRGSQPRSWGSLLRFLHASAPADGAPELRVVVSPRWGLDELPKSLYTPHSAFLTAVRANQLSRTGMVLGSEPRAADGGVLRLPSTRAGRSILPHAGRANAVSSEDRADRLRRLMAEAGDCRTIAITSGKGGVGKSNVALNLGILMAATGNRVGLVDADLGMANLDVLLDLNVRSNLSHVMHGRKSLEDVVVNLPNGVQLVPGASGLARAADLTDLQRARLINQLVRLEEDNDVLLVDTGAGVGPDVLHFALPADNVMVVTTPEPTAMTDAYAVMKVLVKSGFQGHLSLLVNMTSGRQEARMVHQRISQVARQFLGVTVYDAGYILDDPRLRDAVRKREPVVMAYPRCPSSRCLAALARKLCSGGALVDRKEGFFRRVANWFS